MGRRKQSETSAPRARRPRGQNRGVIVDGRSTKLIWGWGNSTPRRRNRALRASFSAQPFNRRDAMAAEISNRSLFSAVIASLRFRWFWVSVAAPSRCVSAFNLRKLLMRQRCPLRAARRGGVIVSRPMVGMQRVILRSQFTIPAAVRLYDKRHICPGPGKAAPTAAKPEARSPKPAPPRPAPPRPAATARQRGECDGATARRVRRRDSATARQSRNRS